MDSGAEQEGVRALLGTEDNRHRTWTRTQLVTVETLPVRTHTLSHFLGAGKNERGLKHFPQSYSSTVLKILKLFLNKMV